MSNFIVRVELHGANAADYDTLHRQMELKGFSRYIVADDGGVYHLPTAEYVITSQETVGQVRDRAYAAAAATGRRAGVIAAKYDAAAWAGLDVAQQPRARA